MRSFDEDGLFKDQNPTRRSLPLVITPPLIPEIPRIEKLLTNCKILITYKEREDPHKVYNRTGERTHTKNLIEIHKAPCKGEIHNC